MARCEYITYKGKRLLFANYTGLNGKELLTIIQEATRMMLADQSGELLFLGDFSNTHVDDEIMKFLQNEESKRAAKNAKKIAVTGIVGIKKIFYNLYNAVHGGKAHAFDTLDQAKEYLIS